MSAKPTLAKDSPERFDVLPPEGKGSRPAGPGPGDPRHQMLSQLIAYVMDNLIKVPGTKRGIGLNPVLDLLSVFGDVPATLMQTFTIWEASRRGVPKIILARMASNILINGAVGMLPGFGEAFAWWFRPSSRNYELLLKHAPQSGGSVAAPARQGTTGDYLFIFGLLAVVLIVAGMFIAVGFLIIHALYKGLVAHL